VDGIINFTGPGHSMESAIVSVKSGSVGREMIASLKGDMASHGAAMGLFITLEQPTGPMKQEAAIAGTYHSEVSGKDYPKVQIITIRGTARRTPEARPAAARATRLPAGREGRTGVARPGEVVRLGLGPAQRR
jgi:Restriction endonuclease